LPGMEGVPPEEASAPPSPTKRSKKTITFLLPDVTANDAEPSDDTETPKVVLDEDNAKEDEDVPSTDEAPKRAGSSWRHRQREVYAYPDLQAPPSYRYRLPGGRYFWQMPFRHTLYQQLAEPKAQETSSPAGAGPPGVRPHRRYLQLLLPAGGGPPPVHRAHPLRYQEEARRQGARACSLLVIDLSLGHFDAK